MEWLTEMMKSPAPVAFVLGGGLAVVWAAYLGKDKALLAEKDARITDLKDIAKGASKN